MHCTSVFVIEIVGLSSGAVFVVCGAVAGLVVAALYAAGLWVFERYYSHQEHFEFDFDRFEAAVGESSVILLHPPLPLVGVSIETMRGGANLTVSPTARFKLYPTMVLDFSEVGGRDAVFWKP